MCLRCVGVFWGLPRGVCYLVCYMVCCVVLGRAFYCDCW